MPLSSLNDDIMALILDMAGPQSAVAMATTSSHFNHVCNIVMYSKVGIFEVYSIYLRFERTYRFFKTVRESNRVCHYIRSITIFWDYPPKVLIGFESLAEPMRLALMKTYRLTRLKLEIRLKDKTFEKCFGTSFRFRLSEFECNFGTEEAKRKFMEKHSDKGQMF